MCMGPPLSCLLGIHHYRVYPHVYGATCLPESQMLEGQGLSPCVWGHRSSNSPIMQLVGSIPMCMGPPHPDNLLSQKQWVYPHVYGATTNGHHSSRHPEGLSPCVWGHLELFQTLFVLGGSIPMCMGPPMFFYLQQTKLWVYPHVYGATVSPKLQYGAIAGLSPCVWGHLHI